MQVKGAEQTGLFEALYSTRSLRRFKKDPVSDEDLYQVLDAGIRAPAGGNRQVWHFLIVRDEEKRKQVAELYWKTWSVYGKQYVDNPETMDTLKKQQRLVVKSTDHLARNIADVPVHLFICGAPQAGPSLYPAIQNILLACRGLGLGCVLTAFHRMHDKKINELLGIPEGQVAHALMPIGWPSDKIGPVNRLPLHKVTSLDGWGQKWPYAAEQPEAGLRDRWT